MSIVIPSWNGRHLLEQFLPSVISAAHSYTQSSGAEVEVIIVDDGSTDGTVDWLHTAHPQVVTVRKEKNEGFGPACNHGFARAKHSVVLLLNNDVRVEADILLHLVDHFCDPSVFAVCCKALDPQTNGVATAGKVGQFKSGFWRVHGNYDVIRDQGSGIGDQRSGVRDQFPETSNQRPATSDHYFSILASGGFSAFATEKLRQLGGFDSLLAPFYWEDVDLSLRAWKRGWKILYEPGAVVYHETSSTIRTHFSSQEIDVIAQRNRLIAHWINLHDPGWLVEHLAVVVLLVLSSLLTLNFTFWRAFLGACRNLPVICWQRNQERHAAQVSDRELARLMATAICRPEVRLVNR
ncbi:MAG: glycosyltransferase family 2 protein [Acidobacteria bacterium]|nr:glycosyltransferase family 2 protein [Acidobacteriota bacterium]